MCPVNTTACAAGSSYQQSEDLFAKSFNLLGPLPGNERAMHGIELHLSLYGTQQGVCAFVILTGCEGYCFACRACQPQDLSNMIPPLAVLDGNKFIC